MKIRAEHDTVFFSPLEGIFRSTPTMVNEKRNRRLYADLHNTSRGRRSNLASKSSERIPKKNIKPVTQRENKINLK